MLSKNSCKKIGQLLKKSNGLQFYYYEANKRMSVKEVPSELIGFKCLSMILDKPSKGIKFLKKKLLQEVTDEVAEKKANCSLTVAERNLVNLEYFS